MKNYDKNITSSYLMCLDENCMGGECKLPINGE